MDTGQRTELNRYALLVTDHVNAMLAYWDNDLVCRFANKAYLEWFGKKQEEMIDKITLDQLLGPLYEKNLPYIQAVLKGEPQTFERQIPIPGGKGVRHSLANYFPHIVEGKVQGFFVHVADISPVEEMKEQLSNRNNRLLNFANTVSHNLRAYAGNLSSILDLHDQANSVEEKTEMLSHLRLIISSFANTIQNLDEIVRVENASKVTLTQIDIHDYITKATILLKLQIDAARGTVKNCISPKTFVQANPSYLESVILNLISNAIKYKHPDRDPVIELSGSFTSDGFVFKVKDNGVGLDLVKYGKDLFGLFKTFHGNADAQGVGLYITKFQIEAMNARIDTESEPGRGTTFILHFKV